MITATVQWSCTTYLMPLLHRGRHSTNVCNLASLAHCLARSSLCPPPRLSLSLARVLSGAAARNARRDTREISENCSHWLKETGKCLFSFSTCLYSASPGRVIGRVGVPHALRVRQAHEGK